jgi:DNA-binding GntR family transcriptional regulator
MAKAGYKHVASELRAAIERGEYPPGSMLPSQLTLAKLYGLNQTTINRAVNLLANEGLVRVEHGKGAFVMEAVGDITRALVDIDILQEALLVYMKRMDKNIKEIQMGQARGELGLKYASDLIKTFEEQKARAQRTRKALFELES